MKSNFIELVKDVTFKSDEWKTFSKAYSVELVEDTLINYEVGEYSVSVEFLTETKQKEWFYLTVSVEDIMVFLYNQ